MRRSLVPLIGLSFLLTQAIMLSPVRALQVATGAMVVEVYGGSLTDTSACSMVTWTNATVNMFGTDVNFGTSVQRSVCFSQTIAGVQQPGWCKSIDLAGALTGAFDSQGGITDVVCSEPSCLGTDSFVASNFSVSGSVAAALPLAAYTVDGSVGSATFVNGPSTIPQCPLSLVNVRFTGSGTLNAFQAVATPSGANVSVASSTTFLNPINGQSVDVSVNIDFAAIGTPGSTLVTATSNVSGALSSNFVTAVDGYQATFLDIHTTAEVAPPITICTNYADADNDGIIDGTTVPETSLRFLHGEGTPVVFVDRTVSQDTIANQICAEVNSLSPFVTVVNLCGNGHLDSGETCDDGNATANDGCSATCHTESGWQCTTPGAACSFVCGNSIVNSSESCDDGNAMGGDGCSASCQIESGWQCPTPGSPCTFVCGNGVVDPSEGCDDGGNTGGDGCSADCKVETCFHCTNMPGGSSTCTPQSGTTCSDGDLCTTGDTCQSGACVGTPVQCQSLGQCFDVGTCNSLTGICSNPPKGNGTLCNDGDGCLGDTCESGQCQPASCPNVDAVALAGKPLSVTIGTGTTSVTKTVSITVRNADAVSRTISLAVDASDCPAGVAGDPDFDPSTPAADSSVLVLPGKTKKAKVPVTIQSSAFDSFNFKAPARCTLAFIASAVVPGGSNDPSPSNNVALVELSVVDKHDSEHAAPTVHETTIKSAPPVAVNIPLHKDSAVKTLKASIGNADYRPSAENPGDPISLSASTTCLGLTLGTPICDPVTSSDTVTVKGGAAKTCKISATAFKGPIDTPNKFAPQRCTVTLAAHGPSDPEMTPLDASNNSTQLVIDLLDKNDN
ncbi:MAG: DUF4215 domain-containing protein [Deltaproteobacteria bacterium]|nr:DUF4215 domain-containing protein [Deltaproteobacteria bacterium]